MKVGDLVVVRATRYRVAQDAKPIPGITKSTPAWFVGRFSDRYLIEGEVALIAPEFSDEKLEAIDWDGDYELIPEIDEFEIIPASEWPAKVCAAVMKQALLGDANV
jgi:hypothetical protein